MASGLNSVHLFLLLLAVERCLELRIARRNAARVLALGGREYDAAFTRLIVLFHVSWFAAFALEAFFGGNGPAVSPVWPAAAFLVLQILRYWCIVSLDGYWNTKIIALPGGPLVRKGPYRFLKHPNYVVVLVEIFLYPALFGCWATAVLFGIANIFILRRRIRQEDMALGRQ